MNIDEKIQLNGYKVDSGVCYAYFPNDQVSVTNKISHSNVQIVENGCNDNEFEEIDSECQCDVVNYNEHDGDSDDLNGNNDNDFEGGDSQFQNEVADYYKHDSESGDDFNKDHYQRNHDYDGNGGLLIILIVTILFVMMTITLLMRMILTTKILVIVLRKPDKSMIWTMVLCTINATSLIRIQLPLSDIVILVKIVVTKDIMIIPLVNIYLCRR